ncbi:unnamed protein product [Peronospora belbahrii]|uniref:Uncharacterized protein n=1 Tax=Peronospora belbahrii TaxID=622444 RepID=A0AAU9KS97_9STRA|nr:unnamed protein product [Peronospora belbahrii]
MSATSGELGVGRGSSTTGGSPSQSSSFKTVSNRYGTGELKEESAGGLLSCTASDETVVDGSGPGNS